MHSIDWALIMKRICFYSREYTLHTNGSTRASGSRWLQSSYPIKRITCHSIDDQNSALREIENCRKLDSEHIIKVVEYESKDQADIVINTTSTLYIVLPSYKNGSLADHLSLRAHKQDNMPEVQILQIFLGVYRIQSRKHVYVSWNNRMRKE